MPIRLSGINSGLDTDAIVKELVSAYSLKTEKYEKQKTKLEWKQDAWKGLNTKIYGLYTNISNLRFESAYNLKKTTLSDSTKATVTAASGAVTGTQRLNVLQTAQASYITGGFMGEEVTASSTLKDLGYTGGNTAIKVKDGKGKDTVIEVNADTKISDLIGKFKDAGLNANFDTNNNRIFLSAKESGAAGDFNLVADGAEGNLALSVLGLNTALVDDKGNFINGGEEYKEAYELYKTANGNVAEYLKAQIDAYKELQQKVSQLEADKNSHKTVIEEYETLQAQLEARKAHNAVYAELQKVGVASKEVEITNEDGTTSKVRQGITSAQLRDMEVALGGKLSLEAVEKYINDPTNGIVIPNGTTAEDVYNVLKANEADVDKAAAYAKKHNNLISKSPVELQAAIDAMADSYNTAKESIATIDEEIANVRTQIKESKYGYLVANNKTQEDLDAAVAKLVKEANAANDLLNNPAAKTGSAFKIKGQDAIIKLNGVEFTSSSNTFQVNGLTIEAQAVTGDGDENAIAINTAVDTQGIYDKIKDFLTEYNSVINEITKLYNADSAKDYEPLSDEERESMSDDQIEKWENKIKSALLRRDNSLGNIMNAMVNSMSQTFEIDGQKLSLGNFGISTLGFLNAAENEQYAFHIDGDEDDENTSGKKDKLMAAIQENPDQIMEFMQKLTSNLYTSIDNKMKSTELSSAYKVYNDKELDKEAKEIEDLIKKWEEKIADQEDAYFKKFSQMEVALSKLQSQTNSLSGLLGQ